MSTATKPPHYARGTLRTRWSTSAAGVACMAFALGGRIIKFKVGKTAAYCRQHAADRMVDVGHRRCSYVDGVSA